MESRALLDRELRTYREHDLGGGFRRRLPEGLGGADNAPSWSGLTDGEAAARLDYVEGLPARQ